MNLFNSINYDLIDMQHKQLSSLIYIYILSVLSSMKNKFMVIIRIYDGSEFTYIYIYTCAEDISLHISLVV